MKKLSLLLVLFLGGCWSYMAMFEPGKIRDEVSRMDGIRTVYMNPAYIYKSDGAMAPISFSLGLYWTSNFPDYCMITAVIPIISNISPDRSLRFNIDGKLVELSDTNKELTHFDVDRGTSSRDYAVKREFIKELVSAKSVLVQVNSFEGEFHHDKMQAARPAFRQFLQITAPKTDI